MMGEELHLQPVQTADIFRGAVMITVAILVGHLIPLLPFVWLPRAAALITAFVLSAGVLFGAGVCSSVTLVGDWRKMVASGSAPPRWASSSGACSTPATHDRQITASLRWLAPTCCAPSGCRGIGRSRGGT